MVEEQSLTIEKIKISDLKFYENNSRTHSDAQVSQIVASIEEFGFTNPVLIDGKNEIIAGHGRVMAAKKIGLEDVPCIRLGYLTEAQRRAYVIADNKLALNAGWNDEMLLNEFKALEELNYDLSFTGFDDEEISRIYDDFQLEDEGGDEDEPPKIQNITISHKGNIWALGNHRLMCGDSTCLDDVSKLMNGEVADQLVTDPPYNVDYQGKTGDALSIQNDSMDDSSFRQFLVDAYKAADSVLKPGGVFYVWHADSEGYNFRGAAFEVGWNIRQCLIWKKHTFVLGRQDYQWQHEPCLYGWKDGDSHYWGGDRKQTTILEFDRPNRNDIHPTMKPVNLIEYCIKNNTRRGENVLDLFGGSGSTLIAAENLGRRAFLMELDEKYVDVIIRRWEEKTGDDALLVETGETFKELEKAILNGGGE